MPETEVDQPDPLRLVRFEISGFRKLIGVSVDLAPFSVIIGANSCGKTSLLDSIEMMCRAFRGDLQSFFHEQAGFSQVASKIAGIEEVKLKASFRTSARYLRYAIDLSTVGYGYKVSMESLGNTPSQFLSEMEDRIYVFDGTTVLWGAPHPDTIYADKFKTSESVLMQLPQVQQQETIIQSLGSVINHSLTSSARRSPIRGAQRLTPLMRPYPDGSDLCVRLLDIQQQTPEIYEVLTGNLKAAFNRFERLQLSVVAGGVIGLYWIEKGVPTPLSSDQLSDGILRFLWILSILYHPDCPPLLLFDEPATHFHPSLVRFLIDIFREASSWTQILVTTHSDSIVRFLDPTELLVMEENEMGQTSIKSAAEMNLKPWLEDFSMQELWHMGRLTADS